MPNAISNMELTSVFYQLYSIDIAKKVEVDGGAELTEDFLHSEIHPVITINIITIHHCHQHNFKRLLGS